MRPTRPTRSSRALSALLVALVLVAGACDPQSPPRSTPPGAASPPGDPAPSAAPSVLPSRATDALRLVVDTDMAADDIVAIASLIHDPGVELLAITVEGTGEAHCPGGLFVARSVVTMLADRDIPVACGNGSPLGDAEEFPAEWRAAVDAGSGLQLVRPRYLPDDRSAADLLVELASAEDADGRRLTILTLGTLTNVAGALEADPQLPEKVRLVSMLGAVRVPGNVMTVSGDPPAEWNARADPTAVRRVLEGGFDWTLVPLDATNDVPLTQDLFGRLQSDHAAGPADLVFELWARNPYMTGGGIYLWDPLASMVARDPTVVGTEPMGLVVTEGDGPEGGRLREDPTGLPASVATSADRGRFEAELLRRIRLGPPRSNPFVEVGSLAIEGSPGRCDAMLDPGTPPAGLLRITVTNVGAEPLNATIFELGGVTWEGVRAFIAAYDPNASPPPVTFLTQLGAEAGASSTAFAASPSGNLGVACFTGSFEDPTIALAGPFPIGE